MQKKRLKFANEEESNKKSKKEKEETAMSHVSKKARVPDNFASFTIEEAELAIESVQKFYEDEKLDYCQHTTVETRSGAVCDCLVREIEQDHLKVIAGATATFANSLLTLQKKDGVSKPEIQRRISQSVRVIKNAHGSATILMDVMSKIKTESGSFDHRLNVDNIMATMDDVYDESKAVLCAHSFVSVLRTMYLSKCMVLCRGDEDQANLMYHEAWTNFHIEESVKSMGEEADNETTRTRNNASFRAHVKRYLREPHQKSTRWNKEELEFLESQEGGRSSEQWRKSFKNHGLDKIHIIHPAASGVVQESDYGYNDDTYNLLKPGGDLQYLQCLELPPLVLEVLGEIRDRLPGMYKGEQGSAEAEKKQSNHNKGWDSVEGTGLYYLSTFGNGLSECLGNAHKAELSEIKKYVKDNTDKILKADAALHNVIVLGVNRINQLMSQQEKTKFEPCEHASFQISFLKTLVQCVQDPHFDFPKLKQCLDNFLMFFAMTESGMYLEMFGDGRPKKVVLTEGELFYVKYGYIVLRPGFNIHSGGFMADHLNKIDGNVRGHGYIFPDRRLKHSFVPSNRYSWFDGSYLANHCQHNHHLGLIRHKGDDKKSHAEMQKCKLSYLFFHGKKTKVLSEKEHKASISEREAFYKEKEAKEKKQLEKVASAIDSGREKDSARGAVIRQEDIQNLPPGVEFEEGWKVKVFPHDCALPVPAATKVESDDSKPSASRKKRAPKREGATPTRRSNRKRAAPASAKAPASAPRKKRNVKNSPATNASSPAPSRAARRFLHAFSAEETQVVDGTKVLKGTAIIAGSVIELGGIPKTPKTPPRSGATKKHSAAVEEEKSVGLENVQPSVEEKDEEKKDNQKMQSAEKGAEEGLTSSKPKQSAEGAKENGTVESGGKATAGEDGAAEAKAVSGASNASAETEVEALAGTKEKLDGQKTAAVTAVKGASAAPAKDEVEASADKKKRLEEQKQAAGERSSSSSEDEDSDDSLSDDTNEDDDVLAQRRRMFRVANQQMPVRQAESSSDEESDDESTIGIVAPPQVNRIPANNRGAIDGMDSDSETSSSSDEDDEN